MPNELIALEGYLTLAATGATDPIAITHASRVAIQVEVDNTNAVGEIAIQGSCNKTNWCDIPFLDIDGNVQDGYDLSSGDDIVKTFDIDTAVPWLRILYTRTSGTGGMDFYINKKK